MSKTKYRCEYCGNKQKPEKTNVMSYEVDEVEDLTPADDSVVLSSESAYYICLCSVCQQITIFHSYGIIYEELDFRSLDHVYPQSKTVKYQDYLPSRVYSAVKDVYNAERSMPLFVTGVRRVIERICEDKNARGANLSQKIRNLSSDGIFTDIITKASDIIRVIGNEGVHGDRIEHREYQASEELMKLILDYVYVFPNRISGLEVIAHDLERSRDAQNN